MANVLANVSSAGFIPGPGIAPSATTINVVSDKVEWDFLAPSIFTGEVSDPLFICSPALPLLQAGSVLVSAQLGLEGVGDCIVPVEDPECTVDEDCANETLCDTDTCVDGTCEHVELGCPIHLCHLSNTCNPESGECEEVLKDCGDGECNLETGECEPRPEWFGPYECGEAGCKGKASVKFYSETAGTCYSLKASCKGAFVGQGWMVHLANGGKRVVVETTPDAPPKCEAAAKDLDGVSKVKANCETDSVGACGDQSSAKASVKRQDKLCTPCCEKPNKATGSCDGVCPPPPCNAICDSDACTECASTVCSAVCGDEGAQCDLGNTACQECLAGACPGVCACEE